MVIVGHGGNLFRRIIIRSLTIWGRKGFDEGEEVCGACRGFGWPRKKPETTLSANDNVELALAA